MKRQSWPVQESDVNRNNVCTWCPATLWHEHTGECPSRQKTVVVEVTIQLIRTVPEAWGEDEINFHMNGSSWCAGNIIEDLEKNNQENSCLCPHFQGKYVRDASQEDEETFRVSIDNEDM
jgi:hypothetical protein